MTRQEAEARILEKVREIRDIIQEYEPENTYFDLTIYDCNRTDFHNEYWETDKEIQVRHVPLDEVQDDD